MAAAASSDQGGRATSPKKNLYEVIRDQLIGDIETGRYPAGALLPSVRELTAQMAISTTTARKALGEVVDAGYARSEATRGHVSAGPRPQGAQHGSTGTVEASPQDSGTLLVRPVLTIPPGGNASPESDATPIDVRKEAVPAEVAHALRLQDPAASLFVRRRLTVDTHGTPTELKTSYMALELDEGSPLCSPKPLPEGWGAALEAHSGQLLGELHSQVTARHPTDTEAASLHLRPTACVLVRMETTHDRDGQPLDHTVTVWPGESTRLSLTG